MLNSGRRWGRSRSPTFNSQYLMMSLLTPEEWKVIALSVRVGIFCVLISLPPGVFLGWLLARIDFGGKSSSTDCAICPWSCPRSLQGYLLLLLLAGGGSWEGYSKTRWAPDRILLEGGRTGLGRRGISADASRRPSGRRRDRSPMERVARTSAPASARFLHSDASLAFPGVLAGSLLTFARSPGGIRGDYDIRLQYLRRDAKPFHWQSHLPQPARRGNRCSPPGRVFDRSFTWALMIGEGSPVIRRESNRCYLSGWHTIGPFHSPRGRRMPLSCDRGFRTVRLWKKHPPRSGSRTPPTGLGGNPHRRRRCLLFSIRNRSSPRKEGSGMFFRMTSSSHT